MIWKRVYSVTRGPLNGCPRRDPRQNSAGHNVLRQREESGQESDRGNAVETPVNWDRIGPLVGGSQGSLVARTIKRGERSLMCGNS
jgi:hypothetical protein